MGIFPEGISASIENMEKRNVVGHRVRQARGTVKPRLTQIDLAARLQLLGISIDQAGVSKIETGRRPVSDIEVAALAKALKISVSWLFEETDTGSPSHQE